jgi:hypothetical protein
MAVLIVGLVILSGIFFAHRAHPKPSKQKLFVPNVGSRDLPLTGLGPHDPPAFENGYRVISFVILGGFNYKATRETWRPKKRPLPGEGPPTHELPAYVKALDGRRVKLQGFMMPIELDDQNVKSFAVLPHMASCCFGSAPKMNRWVFVTTDVHTVNKYDEYESGIPVIVYGTLSVGEKNSEDIGTTLYRLKADTVVVPSS